MRRRWRGWRRWLIGSLLLAAAAAAPARVLVDVVSDDFVLPAKIARLNAAAAPEPVQFRHIAVGPGTPLPAD